VVVVFVALVGTAIWVGPRISANKREHSREDARATARARATDLRRRRIDQRVHTARTAARTLAGATTALEAAIARDLRARQRAGTLPPPRVRAVSCVPLPEDPGLRGGLARLKCLGATSVTSAVSIGFEVVGAVRPGSGRLSWCKTNPAAGEKANGAQLSEVRLAAACFGGRRPGERQVAVAR
jgi:hypothetical protein